MAVNKTELTPIILLIILLSVLSFFPAGNVYADGRIWYVGGSGEGNFSSIQDAIKYAKHGDTIFVYSGVYCEDIRVYKKLKIIGENASSTIIRGTEIAVKIITQDVLLYNFTIETKTKNETVAILMEGPYCKIKNCIIRNSEKGLQIKGKKNEITNCYIVNNTYGVHIEANCVSIKKNIFKNNTHCDILLHAFSIYGPVPQPRENEIYENEFIDGGGIFIVETRRNKICNNSFVNDGIVILHFNMSNLDEIENNTVNGKPFYFILNENNTCLKDAGAIILINCSNVTVEYANLSRTCAALTMVKCRNILINSCKFYGDKIAIYLKNSRDNIIYNNEFSSNRDCIIFSGNKYKNVDNIVKNNRFVNNEIGLYFFLGNSNIISRNNFSHNKKAVELTACYCPDGHSDYNVFTHNVFYDNKVGIVFYDSVESVVENNVMRKNGKAIVVYTTYKTTVKNNVFEENNISYFGRYDWSGIIEHNVFSGNMEGIRGLFFSYSIRYNEFTYNEKGINFYGVNDMAPENNSIFYNRFINNNLSAINNGTNFWDDGFIGNYWSDYGGDDEDGDGIGDEPYLISGGGADRCPMMQQYEQFLLVKKPREGYLYIFDRGVLPVGTKRAVVIGDITIEGSAMGVNSIYAMDENDEGIFYTKKMPFEYKWDLTTGFHTLTIQAIYKYDIVCTKEIEIFAIS